MDIPPDEDEVTREREREIRERKKKNRRSLSIESINMEYHPLEISLILKLSKRSFRRR